MFRQKFSTSSALFGSGVAIELEDLFRRYGSDVLAYGSELTVLTFQDSDDIGHTFYKNQNTIFKDGSIGAMRKATIAVCNLRSRFVSMDTLTDNTNVVSKVVVEVESLRRGLDGYTIYNVSFGDCLSSNGKYKLDPSFYPFANGYIGITKRNPVIRWNEHISSVNSGGGFYFHNAWRSLISVEPSVVPTFKIMSRVQTLEEAYELEEKLVERYTLNPMGLNAIPGGLAGLRMMHLLKDSITSLEDREVALLDLENGRSAMAPHYRKGHIRNLSSKCRSKTTWVSPCWVGMNRVAA